MRSATKFNSTLPLAIGLCLMTLLNTSASEAACNLNVTPSSPDSRFVTNADGTVLDDDTKLIWMRCSLGQSWDGSSCSGTPSEVDWQTALSEAQEFEFAEYSDWRLPDIKELSSIVEQQCYNPSINETVFPGTPAEQYWTSSPYISSAVYGWNVSFYLGYNHHDKKTKPLLVRLVRDSGQ